jgi:DNA-binding GntR family transcriptional regulator
MSRSAPVRRVSVADRVTSEMRRAIVAGRLRPGQEFSLRRIAEQLGVSFIPVREALRDLEAEGLVVTRRGRSAVVAPLDPDEPRRICQLRRRIEPDLAAEARPRLTRAELDRLAAQVARDAQAPADQRYEAYRYLLLDLLRPAATEWDLRTLRVLWRATERYLRIGCDLVERTMTREQGLADAQDELVAGYRAGDPAAARAAMLRHLDWIERVARLGIAAGC